MTSPRSSPPMTIPAATSAKGVGFRSDRGPVLIAVMLSTGLVALDSTIIATAVPSVVKDLGGFSQFPWLFSVYLLTQAVTVPLYGKFADVLGRRPVMFFGIAAFLVGSVLCLFVGWRGCRGGAWRGAAGGGLRAGAAAGGGRGMGAAPPQPMSMTV